jgi:hypothetical protein
MNLNRKILFGAMSTALLLPCTQVSALTLGRLRGAALLGRELDVLVNIQYAADEEIAVSCFDAKLNYGDVQVDSNRTAITLLPGAQANSQTLRLSSRAPVDEAVVSLKLSYACGAKASRNYVLLSDVVSESAVAVPPPASAENAGLAGKSVALALPAVDSAKPAVQVPTTPAAPRPKLKLAAIPAASVHDAAAKALGVANASALQELQHRVDEIAKWQAASTVSAEESLKKEARTKALEADVQGLKLITAKNQQSLQMVAKAVESAQAQDYGRSLVYGLAALLALCLAALAYVVMRVRGKGPEAAPWWLGGERAEVAVPRREPEQPVRSVVPAAAKPAPLKEASTPAAAVPQTAIPQLNGDTLATTPVPVKPIAPAVVASVSHAGGNEFAHSGHAHLKAINTKEMLDVRQQADFFMALGQHDEAVRLLESSIQGSPDANPLVYLDLLKIFHTLSRRADFERYREEFNAQFTGRVPSYANFLQEGNGLDAYDDIAQQIVVLWPTEYTIDFIEQCLVRTPEDEPDQGIDLEAFKDLLLLYGVLKRLDQTLDSAMVPFQASRTANSVMGQPYELGAKAGANTATREAAQPLPVIQPPPLPELSIGVDLDLNLDISDEPAKAKKDDNLIDFVVSGFKSP